MVEEYMVGMVEGKREMMKEGRGGLLMTQACCQNSRELFETSACCWKFAGVTSLLRIFIAYVYCISSLHISVAYL